MVNVCRTTKPCNGNVVSERISDLSCFYKEEKRRMKEEIERRRAEAAEKRQKMPEDGVSEDKKPFKCFSPKGSSLKVNSLLISIQHIKGNGGCSSNQQPKIKAVWKYLKSDLRQCSEINLSLKCFVERLRSLG